MDKVIPIVALGAGAVTLIVATVELVTYRRFRQVYVDANILPGKKSNGG